MTLDSAAIRELEALSARAWRAEREDRLGGWRLYASAGFSRRINGCWSLDDPGLPVGAAIEAVEAWYATQGLPTVFTLMSGATSPHDLAAHLAARGYRCEALSLVMVGAVTSSGEDGVTLRDDPDPGFAAVFAGVTDNLADARERLDTLARTPRPRIFALARSEGAPAAIGACAVEDDWAGVFAMRTLAAARRRGLARQVLGALLSRAGELGARRAWLSVEADNAGAIALYQAAGFAEAYRYVYWRAAG